MVAGGGLVWLMMHFLSRESALRAPYLCSALLGLILWFFAAPRLTTVRIEAARG